jgi:hypothetical protein
MPFCISGRGYFPAPLETTIPDVLLEPSPTMVGEPIRTRTRLDPDQPNGPKITKPMQAKKHAATKRRL